MIRQYFLPDEDFASGVCRTFSEESTDIYLGETFSDEGDIHVELPPNYMQGKSGKSAYQEWLDMGNEGSVQDFLDSLSVKYEDLSDKQKEDLASRAKWDSVTLDGSVTTRKIANGAVEEHKLSDNVRSKLNKIAEGGNGKSAYEIWLEQGNRGTETDFLASLKGDKGDKITYDDLTEEDKNDLASRVEVLAPEIPEEVLSEYAKKSEVPTKISQLTNDSGYATGDEVATAIANTITAEPAEGEEVDDYVLMLSDVEQSLGDSAKPISQAAVKGAINSIENMIVSVINTPT